MLLLPGSRLQPDEALDADIRPNGPYHYPVERAVALHGIAKPSARVFDVKGMVQRRVLKTLEPYGNHVLRREATEDFECLACDLYEIRAAYSFSRCWPRRDKPESDIRRPPRREEIVIIDARDQRLLAGVSKPVGKLEDRTSLVDAQRLTIVIAVPARAVGENLAKRDTVPGDFRGPSAAIHDLICAVAIVRLGIRTAQDPDADLQEQPAGGAASKPSALSSVRNSSAGPCPLLAIPVTTSPDPSARVRCSLLYTLGSMRSNQGP